MHIPFSALDIENSSLLPEIVAAITPIIQKGDFILGKAVSEFEKRFADYHQVPFAIGVSSGTDALILALRALDIGPGDEVITTSNTFITTASSIALLKATPILIDIGDDNNMDESKIEQHITNKTKAILPVHWTGRPCNMDKITAIAKKYNIAVIEDCAQAVSARYRGTKVGTFGTLGCFSLHPYKTLNACGDAGIIITSNEQLATKLKALRQNGLDANGVCNYWSGNSRLDTMQAAILNIKFDHFEKWTARRIEIAEYYTNELDQLDEVTPPPAHDDNHYSVYHTYIIKAKHRDALRIHLQKNGIETRIHYQVPIYQQPIAKKTLNCSNKDFPNMENYAIEALSLPIYPSLDNKQQEYIIGKIKEFYSLYSTTSSNTFATA